MRTHIQTRASKHFLIADKIYAKMRVPESSRGAQTPVTCYGLLTGTRITEYQILIITSVLDSLPQEPNFSWVHKFIRLIRPCKEPNLNESVSSVKCNGPMCCSIHCWVNLQQNLHQANNFAPIKTRIFRHRVHMFFSCSCLFKCKWLGACMCVRAQNNEIAGTLYMIFSLIYLWVIFTRLHPLLRP